jgi:CBS-domain-containing membrane protein
MKTVGELMTRELITLKETQNLSIADELLRLHRIRHLPVVREGKLVRYAQQLVADLDRRSEAAEYEH